MDDEVKYRIAERGGKFWIEINIPILTWRFKYRNEWFICDKHLMSCKGSFGHIRFPERYNTLREAKMALDMSKEKTKYHE